MLSLFKTVLIDHSHRLYSETAITLELIEQQYESVYSSVSFVFPTWKKN